MIELVAVAIISLLVIVPLLAVNARYGSPEIPIVTVTVTGATTAPPEVHPLIVYVCTTGLVVLPFAANEPRLYVPPEESTEPVQSPDELLAVHAAASRFAVVHARVTAPPVEGRVRLSGFPFAVRAIDGADLYCYGFCEC